MFVLKSLEKKVGRGLATLMRVAQQIPNSIIHMWLYLRKLYQ